MTRVDFFATRNASTQARLDLACRVTAKAQQQGLRVHILTENAAMTDQLDQRLWTWQDGSFLAHETQANADCNITLHHDWSPEEDCQVLINLTHQVPDVFSRYDRLAECIDGDESCRAAGRKRYKFFRDRGYDPQFHELNS